MSSIKEKLYTLVSHMDSNRQVGHTTTVIHGAKKIDSIVVCHTRLMTDYLGKKGGPLSPYGEVILKEKPKGAKVECVSLNSLDCLRGNTKPIVFDNAALHVIFTDAVGEISDLENEVVQLKDRLKKIRALTE